MFPGLAVYSGGKFFVEGVSQGLRLETAGTGLKVTTIQPGNVATDLRELSDDRKRRNSTFRPAERVFWTPRMWPYRSYTRSGNPSTSPSTRSW